MLLILTSNVLDASERSQFRVEVAVEHELEFGWDNTSQVDIEFWHDWENRSFLVDPSHHFVRKGDRSEIFIDSLSRSAVSVSDCPFVMCSYNKLEIFFSSSYFTVEFHRRSAGASFSRVKYHVFHRKSPKWADWNVQFHRELAAGNSWGVVSLVAWLSVDSCLDISGRHALKMKIRYRFCWTK